MSKRIDMQKTLVKATFIIIFFTVISKMLGMLRESIIAGCFGASYKTDAFNIALMIPSVFMGVVYGSISTTFIPTYSKYLKDKTEAESRYFLNNIFNIVVIVSVIITTVGIISAPYLVRIIAPGFKGDAVRLCINLTVLLFVPVVFLALSNLANGYLQSHGQFAVPALVSIPFNIAYIGSLFIFYRYGIIAAAVGMVAGTILQFVVQVPAMIKSGYRFMAVVDFKEEGLRSITVLVPPVLISCLFNQAYIIIDRMLASGLNEGSISAMDYANKVNSLVYYVFINSLVTVSYPTLALIAVDTVKLLNSTVKVMKLVILVTIPMTTGILQLKTLIVSLLFERGMFNVEDTNVTSVVLGCLSIGIIGIGFREVLNRTFYSLKDTKTPMLNGITAISINIVLDLAFVRLFGVWGLAIATSIAAIISGSMLLARLRKKLGKIKGKELGVCFLKAMAASLVMVLTILCLDKTLFSYVPLTDYAAAKALKLGVYGITGGAAYVAVLHFLKVEEVGYALSLFKKSACIPASGENDCN